MGLDSLLFGLSESSLDSIFFKILDFLEVVCPEIADFLEASSFDFKDFENLEVFSRVTYVAFSGSS